jgi:uncharacterized Zn finger protein (UPF0148 family)
MISQHKCPNCFYELTLLEKRGKYKCAKCGKLFPQKKIEDQSFKEWNKKRKIRDEENSKKGIFPEVSKEENKQINNIKEELEKVIGKKEVIRLEKKWEYMNEYNKRPDVKKKREEYNKEYSKRPKVKEKIRAYKREYVKRFYVKEKRKKFIKEYTQKASVKAKRKIYESRPEVKKRKAEYMREYSKRPEVKKKIEKYNEKYYAIPEIKEKRKNYMKNYNQKQITKDKKKEYEKRFEVRERKKKYMKKYNKRVKNLNSSYTTQSQISVFKVGETAKFDSNGTFLNIPIYF